MDLPSLTSRTASSIRYPEAVQVIIHVVTLLDGCHCPWDVLRILLDISVLHELGAEDGEQLEPNMVRLLLRRRLERLHRDCTGIQTSELHACHLIWENISWVSPETATGNSLLLSILGEIERDCSDFRFCVLSHLDRIFVKEAVETGLL